MAFIVKKNGVLQEFCSNKIIRAIEKSSERVCVKLTDDQKKKVVDIVYNEFNKRNENVSVLEIHNMVECALDVVDKKVAESYREYRNYKTTFSDMIDKVYNKKLSLNFMSDRSNANADSALVTTQKAIVYSELNTEFYKKFFLNDEERQATEEGYIYPHDKNARLDAINCFSKETKFLTTEGLKSFEQFVDGDTIQVYSHTGNKKIATVHSFGKQHLNKITLKSNLKEELFVVYATKNHRWILNDFTVTDELRLKDKLCPNPFENSEIFEVVNIEYTDRFEEVWCLIVEDEHSFLLEKNIPTGNCCLYDMENVLKGGFSMGNIDYNEPKTITAAFHLMYDVSQCAGASQYGGFTIPEVDKLLAPYCEKSYNKYKQEFYDLYEKLVEKDNEN